MISPKWVEIISWDEQKVFVNLSREKIKQSHEYIEGYLLSLNYETALHKHYSHPRYWEEVPVIKKHSR